MPPIVYLHGFASSPASSKARHFRERLEAAGAAVIVPDLAAGDFANLTLSGQLELLERVVDGRPVDLVGSSMGGYLAALFAARHALVRRLVLLAPAFRFHQRWQERLGAAEIDRWRREDSLKVFHYGEGRIRSLRYGLMRDSAQYEAFPEVSQPVLIFHGEHDDIVPVASSIEFAARHPNATLEVVDSGHDLLNVLPRIADKSVEFLTEAV
jgi:pimeloyl-ACP methyl ester carboxylesterase